MKKTLKNIMIGATIVGALTIAGCKKTNKGIVKRNPIPTPSQNQSIILHPDYLAGKSALGYTLLTDLDVDGKWDLAEIKKAGYTLGDYSKGVYFKKGYAPSQSADVKFVNEDFFKPYQ